MTEGDGFAPLPVEFSTEVEVKSFIFKLKTRALRFLKALFCKPFEAVSVPKGTKLPFLKVRAYPQKSVPESTCLSTGAVKLSTSGGT